MSKIRGQHPGQTIPIGKPDEILLKEVEEERKREDERITEHFARVSIHTDTIIKIENFPGGRAVREQYGDNPINAYGSTTRGGRFNFKPRQGRAHETLYAADQEKTALKECTGTIKPRDPWLYFPINLTLQRTWDLRGDTNCRKNGIDRTELLAKNWQYFQDILMLPSYSQRIGELAYKHEEIEAICWDSAVHPGGFCFAIFTKKMLAGSTVSAIDPKIDKVVILLEGVRVLDVDTK